MKLTIEDAIILLEAAKKKTDDYRWIKHSLCVGNTAEIIAKSLQLDHEYAKILGYIHDIGKTGLDNYEFHDIEGYKYLEKLGFDEEYCNICLTHSYLNNDYKCVAGGIPKKHPLRTDFIKNHKYNIYEELINLCDLMCTTKTMPMEERLIDLLLRKGVHKNSHYHLEEALKLKNKFETLLGFELKKIFSY